MKIDGLNITYRDFGNTRACTKTLPGRGIGKRVIFERKINFLLSVCFHYLVTLMAAYFQIEKREKMTRDVIKLQFLLVRTNPSDCSPDAGL